MKKIKIEMTDYNTMNPNHPLMEVFYYLNSDRYEVCRNKQEINESNNYISAVKR